MHDPIFQVLLGFVVFFISAKIGGFLAAKIKQPVVLGELLAGFVVGNLHLVGFDKLQFLASDPFFAILAGLGVILLLFDIGLESSLSDLLKVGGTALLVAVIGVLCPFLLGTLACKILLPGESFFVHLFIASTLCATSVGITARVLKDLQQTKSKNAQIILGASVIDDVLGLIILTIVTGIIVSVDQGLGSQISIQQVAWISLKAIGFLVIVLFGGVHLAPGLFRLGSYLRVEGALLSFSLVFCFGLAYLAGLVGLAPIVGSFAAGLIMDRSGYAKFFVQEHRSIEDLIFPLSEFFVPIFFVHVGMQVNLATFWDPAVIGLGLALSFAGILGKLVCGLGAFGSRNRSLSPLVIGVGMIPRGEVGLIFAMMGLKLKIHGHPLFSPQLYSAIIMMIVVTTIITPPLLKLSIDRTKK